jgi:hypothetical protein
MLSTSVGKLGKECSSLIIVGYLLFMRSTDRLKSFMIRPSPNYLCIIATFTTGMSTVQLYFTDWFSLSPTNPCVLKNGK